jgi:hypothetical protein
MIETKKCSRCNLQKEITNFGTLKSSEDGYAHVCKECYKVIYEQYKQIKYAEKYVNVDEKRKL